MNKSIVVQKSKANINQYSIISNETLTSSNYETIHNKNIDSIILNQNRNLKEQTQFLKKQIKKCFESQKKKDKKIKQYQIQIEVLSQQIYIHKNQCEELVSYMNNWLKKLQLIFLWVSQFKDQSISFNLSNAYQLSFIDHKKQFGKHSQPINQLINRSTQTTINNDSIIELNNTFEKAINQQRLNKIQLIKNQCQLLTINIKAVQNKYKKQKQQHNINKQLTIDNSIEKYQNNSNSKYCQKKNIEIGGQNEEFYNSFTIRNKGYKINSYQKGDESNSPSFKSRSFHFKQK